MRLSEAIREGSKGVQQHFGDWGNASGTELCALGAARSVMGHEGLILHPAGNLAAACPAGCTTTDVAKEWCYSPGDDDITVRVLIAHVNDVHQWTFEQIADWVQLQEALHGLAGEPVEQKEPVLA